MVVCIWRNKKNPCNKKATEGGRPYETYQKVSDSFKLEVNTNQANQPEPEYMQPLEYPNPCYERPRIDKHFFSSSLKTYEDFSTTTEDNIFDENSSPGGDKREWFKTTIANPATQPEPEYMEPLKCIKHFIKDKECKSFDISGTAMEYDASDRKSSSDCAKRTCSDTNTKPNPYVLL